MKIDLTELFHDHTKSNHFLETLLEYGVDRENKTVYFHEVVEEDTASTLIQQLRYVDKYLCKKENDFITLEICSPGGLVDSMFAIYDAIQQLDHRIITVGTGTICSAAFLILACSKERYATENSFAMIHKITGGAVGNEEEMQAQASLFKKQQQLFYELLSRHTNLSAAEWKTLLSETRESWFNPAEMVKVGLVDSVIKPKNMPPKPKAAPKIKKITKKRKK